MPSARRRRCQSQRLLFSRVQTRGEICSCMFGIGRPLRSFCFHTIDILRVLQTFCFSLSSLLTRDIVTRCQKLVNNNCKKNNDLQWVETIFDALKTFFIAFYLDSRDLGQRKTLGGARRFFTKAIHRQNPGVALCTLRFVQCLLVTCRHDYSATN